MKHVLALFLAISLTTGAFAQTTSDQEPTAVSNAFFKAMLEEDAATMGKLLTDDFMLVSNEGRIVDKSLLLQGISGGYLVLDTGTLSNMTKPRMYNSDAAVVTGNWKQKGTLQDQAFSNEVVFSVVCTKVGNSWKIANVQLSTLPN